MISFMSGIDLYFAIAPDQVDAYGNTYMVVDPTLNLNQAMNPVRKCPWAGPHWQKSGINDDTHISWPAVYVRDGAVGNPSRSVKVSFETNTPYNGTLRVRATCGGGYNLQVREKTVQFNGGRATEQLELRSLPTTVDRMNGIELQWQYRTRSRSSWQNANTSKHTLLIIDAAPKPANLRGQDKYLFDIVNWSCQWARNKFGTQDVFEAIWSQFDRGAAVSSPHATGLVYWKNHNIGIAPAQTIPDAVRSRTAPANQRFAASCIVFDRVLMNCLAVQGIRSKEVTIFPHPPDFQRAGLQYSQCSSWNAKNVPGQAQPNPPAGWSNHWIADVEEPAGSWKLYDASYGAGAINRPNSTVVNAGGHNVTVYQNLTDYETAGVDSFNATGSVTGSPVTLAPDADPAIPPHLWGRVLWP